MSYALTSGVFKTPHGREARMAYRQNTNDYNTLNACMTEDEYRLASYKFSGAALDIGGYLGGVGIGLAIDNPNLRVTIVEPVPPNAELIRQNIATNGLGDRVTLIEGAAGGKKPVDIWYGYRGDATLEHHAFVGNSSLAYAKAGKVEHDSVRYDEPWTLTALVEAAGGHVSLLKIDCEGGEWTILDDPAVAQCDVIIGEWHNVQRKTQADLTALLPDHEVTFIRREWATDDGLANDDGGPQGFVATLR